MVKWPTSMPPALPSQSVKVSGIVPNTSNVAMCVMSPRRGGRVEALGGLDIGARAMIARADTLFVASRSRPEAGAAGGVDISHRGGRAGFVHVDGDSLTIPDFPGNGYYNTLGNLLGEPRASLLLIDFENGDVLQLQGIARIDWNAQASVEGAERLWHFEAVRGWHRRVATSLRWSFVDYSPETLKTGSTLNRRPGSIPVSEFK